MVDFSKPGEIWRWLDTVGPEHRRREVAVALAARAALRVTPLLGQKRTRSNRGRAAVLSDLLLSTLRANSLSWVAARYPAHARELGTTAYATYAAARAVAAAASVHPPQAAATRAAAAAAATCAAAADATFSAN